MVNGIDKKALFKLAAEPYLKPISDLGVGFYNLDENTAKIEFQLYNAKGPLLISENNINAYAYFESANGSVSDVIDLEVLDGLNGIVGITLDKYFLQASTDTKVKGQVYVGVNNVDNNPKNNEVAVFREFTFEVADALINKISSFTKIEYIRMFDQLKQRIEQRVNDIEQAIANGADYVAEMKTVKEQGVNQINQTVTEGKAYIDNVILQSENDFNSAYTVIVNDIQTAKDNAITTMNDKVEESLSNVENVSNNAVVHVDDKLNEFNQAITDNEFVQPETLQQTLDNLQWQKHKLTTDSGHNFDIDLSNSLDNLKNLAPGVYYAIRTPSPSGTSGSGFVVVLMREEDHINTPVKKIFFSPYNSNRIFHMRGYKEYWYEGWSEVTNNQTDTNWVAFQLINGAIGNTVFKSTGDNGFDCAYRTITNGNVLTKKVRVNATQVSANQVLAQLPSNFAKTTQRFLIGNSAFIVIKPNGEVSLRVSGDTLNWDINSEIYTELTWHD